MPSTEEREAQPVLEEPCPRCGSPVVLRNWKGRFFTKCQNRGCSFGYDADNRGNPVAHASALGICPKCRKGRLAVRSGSYGTFVSCSERCGLTYASDAQGVPEGGTCMACRGPVKKTPNGSRVCAVCGARQDEDQPAPAGAEAAPAKPKAARCPRCSRPLKAVFTKRGKWAYRCDPCAAWYDA